MEKGGLDAIFFAVFTSQRERTDANYDKAYRISHAMIDSTEKAILKYADRAEIATNCYFGLIIVTMSFR